MKVLVVGATGAIGSAVSELLIARGHQVLTASRTSGALSVDLKNPESIDALYAATGELDTVVCAAGNVTFKSIDQISREELIESFVDKVLGQIELVRRGRDIVKPDGSFVLTTGISARVPIVEGSAAAMANGAVESFVIGVAPELAPQRINAVSPTVLTESAQAYDAAFPGFEPVSAAAVARRFVRALEGRETGVVHRMD